MESLVQSAAGSLGSLQEEESFFRCSAALRIRGNAALMLPLGGIGRVATSSSPSHLDVGWRPRGTALGSNFGVGFGLLSSTRWGLPATGPDHRRRDSVSSRRSCHCHASPSSRAFPMDFISNFPSFITNLGHDATKFAIRCKVEQQHCQHDTNSMAQSSRSHAAN